MKTFTPTGEFTDEWKAQLCTNMSQPTDQRILEIAAEQANNVVSPGAPNAENHNTRTIAHAIDVAVQEERRAWQEWKKTQNNGHAPL